MSINKKVFASINELFATDEVKERLKKKNDELAKEVVSIAKELANKYVEDNYQSILDSASEKVAHDNDDIIKEKAEELMRENEAHFPVLTEEEVKISHDFEKKHSKYTGAIGGQFSFEVTATSIGYLIEENDGEGHTVTIRDL